MRVVLVAVLFAACGPAKTNQTGPVDSPTDGPKLSADDEAKLAKQREVFAPAVRVVAGSKLIVEDFAWLNLFESERLEAQEIIAEWATSMGFNMIDPKASEARVAAAAKGLNPDTNQSCGPELPRPYAIDRWLPAIGKAGHFAAGIYCSPECVLQMQLRLDGRGTEFFAAPFDISKPWRAELKQRLGELIDNGGKNQHGHLNNPVPVAGIKRASSSGDLYQDDGEVVKAEPGLVTEVQSCAIGHQDVKVLVGMLDGKPHCEAYADTRFDPESNQLINTCVCKAILKTQVGGQLATRRVIEVPAAKPFVPAEATKNGKKIWAMVLNEGRFSEQPWTDQWFFPECDGLGNCYSLNDCFVDRTEVVESVQVNASIEFDADGNATNVALADFAAALDKDERACISKRLMAARVPCPDKPSSSRSGRVSLSISAQ